MNTAFMSPSGAVGLCPHLQWASYSEHGKTQLDVCGALSTESTRFPHCSHVTLCRRVVLSSFRRLECRGFQVLVVCAQWYTFVIVWSQRDTVSARLWTMPGCLIMEPRSWQNRRSQFMCRHRTELEKRTNMLEVQCLLAGTKLEKRTNEPESPS